MSIMTSYCSRFAGGFDPPYFSTQIDPNMEVIYPAYPPLPGQQIVGYNIYPASKSCLVLPFQRPMNFMGAFSSFLLLLFFWPATCLPFCMGCSYSGYQTPVYA